MATGDVVVFEEAKATMIEGGWEATDDIKLAICDNTVAPTAATGSPALALFTQVTAAGTYTTGGTSIGDLQTCVSEAGGVMTFDSATNPTWAQDASNDVDAYWGIIYNDTQTSPTIDPAIAYVELGGPVDMQAGSLTVTWNGSGIFTIT